MEALPNLQYDRREFSIIVACFEPIRSRILEVNPHSCELEYRNILNDCAKGEHYKKEQATEGGAIDGAEESYASFTSNSSSNAMYYFAVPNPTYPRTRIRFGSAKKADFILPKEYGVADYHFDIYVNRQPAWMMNIRHRTRVNEEKLRDDQVAMHPEDVNILRIRSLIMHIFIVNDVLSSGWDIDQNLVPYSLSSNMETQTSSSTSTRTISRGTVQQLQQNSSQYHVLRTELQTASSRSKIRVVIYKDTGARAIAKSFDGGAKAAAMWQVKILFGILKEEEFLIPLKASLYSGLSLVVLSEYFDGQTLDYLLYSDLEEPYLEIFDLLQLYVQLGACALEWLRKQEIIHRNIRPSVILVQTIRRVSARLTGFSECCKGSVAQGLPGYENDPWVSSSKKYRAPEMLGAEQYSHPVDMFSLSAIMDEALSRYPSLMEQGSYMRDLVHSGLDQYPGSRLTPSSLRQTLEQSMGSLETEWPPFRSVLAVRAFVLNCNRSEGIDYVSSNSLKEVLNALRHSGDKAALTAELRWVYAYGREHMKLRSAIKYCHQDRLMKLEQSLMENLNRESSDGTFQIIFGVNFDILYHAPSLMVNITHILRIVGEDTFSNLDYMSNIQPLKVIGSWQGEYVPYITFQQLLNDLSQRYQVRLRSFFHKINNSQLDQRITAIDSSRYSVLAVDQLHPHLILLRIRDSKLHLDQLSGKPSAWDCCCYEDNQFVSVADAQQLCSGGGMQRALFTLAQTAFDAVNVPPPPCTDVDDGTVTSIGTSSSVEKEESDQREQRELQFRLRNRLRGEPVATLKIGLRSGSKNLYQGILSRLLPLPN